MRNELTNRRSLLLGTLLVMGGVPLNASAALPPLEVAVAAVGESAQERRAEDWEVQLVHEGTRQSLRFEHRDVESVVFGNEAMRLEVSAEGEEPWAYVGMMLFANELGGLATVNVDRFEGPRRVKSVGGRIVFCYGEEEQICFDRELRSIVSLDVRIEDSRWEFRSTGRSLQVSENGALRARFRGK